MNDFAEKRSLMDKKLDQEEAFKQHLLSKAEISLLLDSYDDIFSDFDPRPFTHRAVSGDFLLASKEAARDKEGALELSFMIPKSKRNVEHEIVIKKRLRDHFNRHSNIIAQEIRNIKKEGSYYLLAGFIMLIFATLLSTYLHDSNIFINLLLIISEPSGWFLFWVGGEKLVYEQKDRRPELEFYKKMTQAEITFHPY